MREVFQHFQPGDRLTDTHMNKVSDTLTRVAGIVPGSFVSGRDGALSITPGLNQKLVEVVSEDWALGEAEDKTGLYEIRPVYYDNGWKIDESGHTSIVDANATGDAFKLGDVFPVYWSDQASRWIRTGGSTSSTTTNAPSNCGCCNCLDCINARDAVVNGCSNCPKGAAQEYEFDLGSYSLFPALAGLQTVIYSEPTSMAPDPCVWYSDDIAVVAPPWLPDTEYYQNDYAINDGGKQYKCTQGGISAGVLMGSGPKGTGTGIVDGGVTWDYSP